MADEKLESNKKSRLRFFGKSIVGILTTFLTFIAAYELLSENRSYPYYSGNFGECEVDEYGEGVYNASDADEAILFLFSNIENAVYIDLLQHYNCPEQGEVISNNQEMINFNFNRKSESSLEILSVSLSFDQKKIDDEILTFAGAPGADMNGGRVRGVFFLKGEIEAGIFDLKALPVPYSADMQRKYTCSKSLTQASSLGKKKKIEAYFRSCIFEQPWDSWGWGAH